MSNKNKPKPRREVQCPFCGEVIPTPVLVCPHCRYWIRIRDPRAQFFLANPQMLTALLMIVGFGIAIYNLYKVSDQFTILNKPYVSVTGLVAVRLPPNDQVAFKMEVINSGRLRAKDVEIKIKSKDAYSNLFEQTGLLSAMEPEGKYLVTFRNAMMFGDNAKMKVARHWMWSDGNIQDSAVSYIQIVWRDTVVDYEFLENEEGEQIFGK